MSCIFGAGAILLAAVFGTLASKFYDGGKVAANTIGEINAQIALLRNETETHQENMMVHHIILQEEIIRNKSELFESINDLDKMLKKILCKMIDYSYCET